LVYPTSIGWIKGYQFPDDWPDAWTTVQRGHAIANGIHVAVANRVGDEKSLRFWGGSFVSDPFGKILKKASDSKEEVIVQKINLAENERIRNAWGFLRNRRPESYGVLTRPPEQKPRQIPAQLGYYFPPEWHPHERVFVSWPHDRISFPYLQAVEKSYIQFIRAIQETKSEQVNLFVTGNRMRSRVRKMLLENGCSPEKIHFFEHSYADVWFRDYGPTFVIHPKRRKIAMIKWNYNAYGEKYPTLMKDDNFPARINKTMKLPLFHSGMILEGGAIETNGKTLLTTEQCLLNPNRNTNFGKEYTEQILKENLGISSVIWLKNGLAGDDTDGHIDNLARFVNPRTILCSFEENKKDLNYRNLK
jgi:agmatine deiminase